MDNTILINAIIRFVESHVKEEIDYKEIEKAVGLSYRHFREQFRQYAKMPLKQYINMRKIANITFEMETTNKNLLLLATDFGFDAYDTFTRNFKREMLITPNQYRKENRHLVNRKLIGMGTYAPVIDDTQILNSQMTGSQDGSYILYGVPKVEFSSGKCTPLLGCLESVLTYIGQRDNCSYAWLMGASGAAFRFCWKAGEWDMSNSNLMNVTPQKPWVLYNRAYNAAGYQCNIVEKGNTSKNSFLNYIIDNIDKGNPVIALGVVGPPEACIITGYEQKGENLLGWSYFQDTPEFLTNNPNENSGYFRSSDWWENPSTTALITLEENISVMPLHDTLEHIHSILTMQSAGIYQAGQSAYKSWANDISDDTAFRENSVIPILLSRFFCQADAETMIGEGRYWGGQFFRLLGEKHADIKDLCFEVAELFELTAKCAQQMTTIRQGDNQTDEAIKMLCRQDIRKEIVNLIYEAQKNEQKIIPIIESIMEHIS